MTISRTLAAAALAAATSICGAQTTAASSKTELAQKIIVLQQPAYDNIARGLTEQTMAPLAQATGNALKTQVPEDRREALARELQAEFKRYGDEVYPMLRDKAQKLAPATIGALLEERLSEDELKQVATMIDSPIYKKYQLLAPDMQRVLTEKLVAETRGAIEPKFAALRDTVTKRLGISPAGASAPKAAAPAAKPAASGAKK